MKYFQTPISFSSVHVASADDTSSPFVKEPLRPINKTHNEQLKRPNPHCPFSLIVLCGHAMGILCVYNVTFLVRLMVYHGTTVMTARSGRLKRKIIVYVFDMLHW